MPTAARRKRAACYILEAMQQTAHSHPLTTESFAHPARNVLHFNIEKGMSVADFGAGSGHYIWPMAEAVGASGHVFAIDVQQDLLKRIHNEAHKRGIKHVKVIWADLEKPKASKLADRSLDLVLISNVLFQLDDKGAVVREAKRILKLSGMLAVVDWADPTGPHRKHIVTKDAGAKLLRESGFELVREFAAGVHHWGLIARPMV